jgi:hypothetical protein
MHPLNQSWTIGEKIVAIIFCIAVICMVIIFCSPPLRDNLHWGCRYVVKTTNSTYFTDAVIYQSGGSVKFTDIQTGREIIVSDYEIHEYPMD